MQGEHYFWGVLLAAKKHIEKQTKHHIDWGTIANARLPGWFFFTGSLIGGVLDVLATPLLLADS